VLEPRWALATMMILLLPVPLVFRFSPLGRVRDVAHLAPPVGAPAPSTLAA
jgi:hypothetical protein